MTELYIDWKGSKQLIRAEKINGTLWIHFKGQTFSYAPQKNQSRNSSAGASNPKEILAPMPGKITKVLRQIGEEVKKGDKLVAMEAMKMEYNLEAKADGKVSVILCKVGDQVGLQQRLVELELGGEDGKGKNS